MAKRLALIQVTDRARAQLKWLAKAVSIKRGQRVTMTSLGSEIIKRAYNKVKNAN